MCQGNLIFFFYQGKVREFWKVMSVATMSFDNMWYFRIKKFHPSFSHLSMWFLRIKIIQRNKHVLSLSWTISQFFFISIINKVQLSWLLLITTMMASFQIVLEDTTQCSEGSLSPVFLLGIITPRLTIIRIVIIFKLNNYELLLRIFF